MSITGIQLCSTGESSFGIQLCTKGEGLGVKLCSYQTCPEKLAEAILERQKVAGITTAWDSGDATNPAKQISLTYTSYTDAHYQAYINQISDQFLDGSYSGGASQPTMLTDEYADGIEGCEALYALVCDMVETKKTWIKTNKTDHSTGYFYTDSGSWEDAKTGAEGSWPNAQETENFNYFGIYSYGWRGNNASKHTADIKVVRGKAKVESLNTDISKTVRFYMFFISFPGVTESTYSGDGYSLAAGSQDKYVEVEEVSGSSNADVESSTIISYTDLPTWCDDPANNNTTKALGWIDDVNKRIAIIEWGFTHV